VVTIAVQEMMESAARAKPFRVGMCGTGRSNDRDGLPNPSER
jgi:hypothetical protein